MNRSILLIIFLIVTTTLFSQAWMSLNLQDKIEQGTATFYDYQHDFYGYWEPYHVDGNGYYFENGQKKKAYGWKQFKRWEWETYPRINKKTGEFPKTNEYLEWKKYKAEHPDALRNLYGNWTEIGSFYQLTSVGSAGRINCIAFHPSDMNTFWVGAPTGGLWKTTDYGDTWTCLTNDLPFIGVSSIIIMPDYATSQTLFIGTGDRDNVNGIGAGLFKSTNGGVTWQETGLMCTNLDDFSVNRLLLDTSNVNIMYAATTTGIYRTLNSGTNWTLIKSGDFTDMEFMPGSDSVLYASSRVFQNYTRVYLTLDKGISWQQVLVVQGSRSELAVSPDEPGRMYALVSNPFGGLSGVYRFEDTCNVSNLVFDGSQSGNNILSDNCDGAGFGGQGSYDLSITADPRNADIVYVGGINTWKSIDGGSSWQIVNNGYQNCTFSVPNMHVDKHALEFQPDTWILFEGNDGGICLTYDDGNTWLDYSVGLNINQNYRIGVAQTVNDEVLGGLQDNGSFLWDSGIFSNVGGSDGQDCIIDPSDEDIQYVSNQNSAIKRTLNHWATTTMISNNIFPADHGGWTSPYVLDPWHPEVLYVGYTNLWKSMDRGDNFTMIFNVPDSIPLTAIAIAPSAPNVICIANTDSIYLSTNGGNSFENINNNLPINNDCFIQSIAIQGTYPNKMWVALSGFNANGVWETTNYGDTWHNISEGLPEVPVNVVVQNQLVTSYNEIYAGTLAGVYVKSADQPWTLFNNGLPMVWVNDLEFYYNGSSTKLRAGTWGRGLWESDPFSYESVMPGIWTGMVSDDWFDIENWQFRKVPDSNEDVTIPYGRQNYPYLSGASATCHNLTVEYGASIKIGGSATLTVFNATFKNSLILSGTFPKLVVLGSLNFKYGADISVTATNHSVTVNGLAQFEFGSSYDVNSGSFIMGGANNTSLSIQTDDVSFFDLIIDKSVPGKNTYYSNSSTDSFSIKGKLEVKPQNIFIQYSEFPIFFLGTQLIADGDFRCNAGDVIFQGPSLNFSGSTNSYFNNLTLDMASSNSSFALNSEIHINGNLLIQLGELNTLGQDVYISGNWTNNMGAMGFGQLLGKVIFNGSQDQSINNPESFYRIRLDKPSGLLNISNGTVICSQYEWASGGILVSGAGSFTADDLIDNGIYGDYHLQGGTISLTNAGDRVDLCGNLYIDGGTFNVYGGNDDSYWPMNADASLIMSNGILEFHDTGIYLFNNPVNTFTENITGGTIITSGNFYGNSTNFTPSGGTVKLVGTGDAMIGHGAGSNLYIVEIAKTASDNSSIIPAIPIIKADDQTGKIEKNSDPGRTAFIPATKDPPNGGGPTDAMNLTLDANTIINSNLTLIAGNLDLNGKSLTVYGNFDIYSNLFMTHSADQLIAYGDIRWQAMSTCNITDGLIRARGNWRFFENSTAQMGGISLVSFEGGASKSITSYTTNSWMNDIDIKKTAGSLYLGVASTDTLIIKGNLTVKTANTLHVDTEWLRVEGDITLEQNSNLYLDAPGIIVAGNNLSGAGTIVQTGGTIQVYQNFILQSTAVYHPTSGSVQFTGSSYSYISFNNGNYMHDMVVDKSATSPTYLNAYLLIYNDLTMTSGTLVTSGHNLTICRDLLIENEGKINPLNDTVAVGRNWTNNRGAEGFTEGASTVYLYGTNASWINSNETFYNLIVNKLFGTNNYLKLNSGLSLTVINDLRVQDGAFLMLSNSSLLCQGELKIMSGAGFNANPASTGVVVRCEGDWVDQNNTYDMDIGFNPGKSLVIFQGGDVQVLVAGSGGEIFYDLRLQKTGYEFYPQSNISVLNALDIQSGSWYFDEPDLVHTFQGDFTIESSGSWDDNTCTLVFTGPSNQHIEIVGTNNTDFGEIFVDKEAGTADTDELILLSDLSCSNLTIDNGIISLNSNILECSTFLNILSGGSVTAVDNSVIKMGSGADLTVNGGLLHLSSTSPGLLIPTITHIAGNYAFMVTNSGTLDAHDALFEYMDVDGIYITSTGQVSTNDPFLRCSFRNGAAGGTLLDIENSQHLVIEDADFPANTWSGQYNVTKNATSGDIIFEYATGGFAGPTYERDPNANVYWTGGGTWTGALSSYWTTPGNWWYSIVPDGLMNVYIPDSVPNMPSINISAGYCKTLTLEPLATLTVNLYDLHVLDYADIYGELIINDFKYLYADSLTFKPGSIATLANKASIELTDGLLFENGSDVNMTTGKFIFTGAEDSYLVCQEAVQVPNITNSKPAGYNLILTGNSTYDLTVHGILTNNGGGIFNIQSPHSLIIETALDNLSGFIRADAGTIEFTGNAGQKTFKPNHGDYLKNLTIASTTHLSLSNDHSDSLQINGNLLINSNAGGNSGLDANGMAILIKGEWRNNAGTAAFLHGNGTVLFNGSGIAQRVIGHTDFYIADEQTTGTAEVRFYGNNNIANDLYVTHKVVAYDTLGISGTLHLNAPTRYFNLTDNAVVETGILDQGGTFTAYSGSFLANDLYETVLSGTYIIQGAEVTLTQDASSSINNQAIITINSGTLNIAGGNGISNWPTPTRTASLTMTGGLLHIQDQGILIQGNGFTENISGGAIWTAKDFLINPGLSNFHPTGGIVELYGTQDSHVSMYPSACHFYDLKMNKNTASSVILDDSTYISHDLILESGTFDTNGEFINVGAP